MFVLNSAEYEIHPSHKCQMFDLVEAEKNTFLNVFIFLSNTNIMLNWVESEIFL